MHTAMGTADFPAASGASSTAFPNAYKHNVSRTRGQLRDLPLLPKRDEIDQFIIDKRNDQRDDPTSATNGFDVGHVGV